MYELVETADFRKHGVQPPLNRPPRHRGDDAWMQGFEPAGEAHRSTQGRQGDGHVIGFDALTELPNLTLLSDRFLQASAAAQRHGGRMAVLLVDLNRGRRLGDAAGGDAALKLAARRLVAAFREGDTVSRYGGDEFVVLLAEISPQADVLAIAGKALDALRAPCHSRGTEVRLDAVAGIALYPDDGTDLGALLGAADTAMGRARPAGGSGAQLYCESRGAPQVPAVASPQEALLLSMVAHELRMPLAAIGMVAAQLDRGGAEQVVHGQAVIDRQVLRLSRLIEDLVDLEASRTGRLRVAFSRVPVRALIDETLEICSATLAGRGQRLVVHAAPPDDCFIDGDPLRLTQIVANLLDNASKYTPEGGEIGLAITVTAALVTISVCDDGIGMTPEVLKCVFEPFLRDPRAARFQQAGLGLGLTLVRDLVAAHGGEVRATSDGVDRGSRFIVTLPRRD